MAGILQTPPAAYSYAALIRPGVALAASVLAHWMLLSAPLLDTPWRGVAPHPGEAPLTVRLAPVPDPVPEVPASADPGVRRMPLPAKPAAGSAEGLPGGHSSSGAAQTGTEVPALPPIPDPHYYPAGDLDSYPKPLAPLRLDRLASDGTGELRLEILVDERGVVQDVIFARPVGPGRADEGLRAALAATLFLPARKDGRAVKSRIVLSVKMGTHTFSVPRIFNEEEGH